METEMLALQGSLFTKKTLWGFENSDSSMKAAGFPQVRVHQNREAAIQTG